MDNDNIIRKLMFLSGCNEQTCKVAFASSNGDFNMAMKKLIDTPNLNTYITDDENNEVVLMEQ